MTIGERRERIRIQRRSRERRPDGGFDTVTATIATRWASVRPVRGMEGELAGRQAGTVTYLIEMDSRGADVSADDVLVWATNGDLEMNVREVRRPSARALPLVVVAEQGAVNSG